MLLVEGIKETFWAALPNQPEVRFQIKPLTETELNQARVKWTKTEWNKKTHQKVEYIDTETQRKALRDMIITHVVGWEGVGRVNQETKEIEEITFSRERLERTIEKMGSMEVDKEYSSELEDEVKVTLSTWLMRQIQNVNKLLESDENFLNTCEPGKTGGETGKKESGNITKN